MSKIFQKLYMKIVPPAAHWLRLMLRFATEYSASLSGRRAVGWAWGRGTREHVAFCIHKSVVGVDFFYLLLGWLYSGLIFCVAFEFRKNIIPALGSGRWQQKRVYDARKRLLVPPL
jgi:hypothetical protein